eukprot:759327-Hanusia_phi.AAC.8
MGGRGMKLGNRVSPTNLVPKACGGRGAQRAKGRKQQVSAACLAHRSMIELSESTNKKRIDVECLRHEQTMSVVAVGEVISSARSMSRESMYLAPKICMFLLLLEISASSAISSITLLDVQSTTGRKNNIPWFATPPSTLLDFSKPADMLRKAKFSFEIPVGGARWKDFMLSGIASGIASTAVFPIDLAKTRIQGSLANINGKQYSGIFRTMTKVAREEGLLSLFNGCTPVLLGSIPEGAFCIGMNDASKNVLSKVLKCPQKVLYCSLTMSSQVHTLNEQELPLPAEIFAGAFAGFTQIIVTNPMERVKILQQVNITSQDGVDCYAELRGFRSRGTKLALSGSYERRYRHLTHSWNDPRVRALVGCEIYPLPQYTSLRTHRSRFPYWTPVGIRQAAIELWTEDRLAAFYRGVQGRIGRLAPQMAISLMLFELFKTTFSVD